MIQILNRKASLVIFMLVTSVSLAPFFYKEIQHYAPAIESSFLMATFPAAAIAMDKATIVLSECRKNSTTENCIINKLAINKPEPSYYKWITATLDIVIGMILLLCFIFRLKRRETKST